VTVAVAQGPTTTASKGPATPVAGLVGALALAARKRRPTGGWLVKAHAAVSVGAPMAATADKEPTAPAAGALTPAVKKGRPVGGWGHAAVVAPVAVPTRAPTVAAAAKGPVAGLAGARGDACRDTSGYDVTHNALTRGGSGNLKGGDGRSKGGWSDSVGVEAGGWRSKHGEDGSEQEIQAERATGPDLGQDEADGLDLSRAGAAGAV
jgi:hypothetical protein